MNIPSVKQHSLQTHLHSQLHPEENLEEPSKTLQQILHPFVCYSAECHLQDIEKPIAARVESNETAYPMFLQLVSPCSCEKCTNAIELNPVKENLVENLHNDFTSTYLKM